MILSRYWAGAKPSSVAPLSNSERKIKMNIDEKAMMILEGMEKHMQIDWNLEELYIKAIKVGLMEIEKKEKEMQEERKV